MFLKLCYLLHMEAKYIIYGLIDPRHPAEVRYVGKTIAPKRRLIHHISYARREKTHKANWIKGLLADGVKPEMVIIGVTTKEEWPSLERRMIAELKAEGMRLTNLTAGGEGIDIPHTKEWHAKIGAALKGRTQSAEIKERIRQTLRAKHPTCKRGGHLWTPENTRLVWKDGRQQRSCRACNNARARSYHKPKPQRTTCRRGHPYTAESCYEDRRNRSGREVIIRRCKACTKITNTRARLKANRRR